LTVIDGVVLVSENFQIGVFAFFRDVLLLMFSAEFRCWKVSSSNAQLKAIMAKIVNRFWWGKPIAEHCSL
jgi:hypothetical protein